MKYHKETKSSVVKRLQMNIRLRTLNFRKMLEDKEQQLGNCGSASLVTDTGRASRQC